jgi:hypothetical protein
MINQRLIFLYRRRLTKLVFIFITILAKKAQSKNLSNQEKMIINVIICKTSEKKEMSHSKKMTTMIKLS